MNIIPSIARGPECRGPMGPSCMHELVENIFVTIYIIFFFLNVFFLYLLILIKKIKIIIS